MQSNKIEDYFKEEFINRIEYRRYDLLQKLSLNFALCESNNEESQVTISLLKKTKKRLSKLEGHLASVIREAVQTKTIFYVLDYTMQRISFEYIDDLSEKGYWDRYETETEYEFEEMLENHPSKKEFKIFMEELAQVGLHEYLTSIKSYKTESGFDIPPPNKQPIQSKYLNFNNGRRLNLQERFFLLDKITSFEENFLKPIVDNPAKEKLLALILNCNPKNAQQVLNGSYDSKLREDEILKYIKMIKKE